MNNDFRQRVFLPVILPLGAVIGFFGFAFMLSRVLLAIEELASTMLALGIATYVLAIAGIVAARPRITSRALAVGVTLGILGVVAAGTIAASVGMRELEHAEAETAGGGEPAAGGATEPAAGGNQLEFVAVDIDFESAPASASSGAVEITLVNNGQAEHNVTFPELSEDPVVVAAGGQTETDEVELEPGTYEYICSVPGHEQAMQGELTVE